MIGTTLLFGLTAVVFAVRLVIPATESGRQRLADQVDLESTSDVAAAIDRRTRTVDLGLVLAAVTAAAVSLLAVLGDAAPAIVRTVQATAFVLIWALPAAIGALRPFARPGAQQPRLARLDRPRLAEFLPSWLTAGTVVGTAAAIAVSGAGIAARPSVFEVVAPGLLCAAVTVTAVVGLSAGILATGQPAGTIGQMLWDDALRALALRGLWSAGFGLGVVAVLVSLAAVLGALGLDARPLADAAPLAAMLISVGTIAARLSPRWRLRRWPESFVESGGATQKADYE